MFWQEVRVFCSGARLLQTMISQRCKHTEMVLFERRDPNLKDNIDIVAVCG